MLTGNELVCLWRKQRLHSFPLITSTARVKSIHSNWMGLVYQRACGPIAPKGQGASAVRSNLETSNRIRSKYNLYTKFLVNNGRQNKEGKYVSISLTVMSRVKNTHYCNYYFSENIKVKYHYLLVWTVLSISQINNTDKGVIRWWEQIPNSWS